MYVRLNPPKIGDFLLVFIKKWGVPKFFFAKFQRLVELLSFIMVSLRWWLNCYMVISKHFIINVSNPYHHKRSETM